MKLNLDCVRDVLITLEETQGYDDETNLEEPIPWNLIYEDEILNKSYHISDIKYTIQKLRESNYIKVRLLAEGAQHSWITVNITGITSIGHEFLNTVRPQKVWDQTKSTLISMGIFSLKIAYEIAKEKALKIFTEGQI